MPCVVLINDYKIKILKSEWTQNVNKAVSRVKGISPSVKIFYAPNKQQKPNFELRCEANFHPKRAACYYGSVLKICGKGEKKSILVMILTL